MRRIAAVALATALAACGPALTPETEAPGGYAVARQEAAMDAAPPSAPPPPEAQRGGADGGAQPQPQPNGPAPILYLAYTYGLTLELPSRRLPAVMDAHIQACQDAGPRVCQLINSNRYGDPESQISGAVHLRGEPNWLRAFMSGVAADADAAGGQITGQTTGTDDLTRQMVDAEANLRAKTTLRDRLQALLRERPGRLSDLLAVEQELARVQAEIDAVQSHLAVMRTRVAMSELSLTYQSAPRPLGSDTFRPLRDAFAGFLGIVVQGFAFIVRFIAVLIPILVVGTPVAWALLRWRRRRGGFLRRRQPSAPSAEG